MRCFTLIAVILVGFSNPSFAQSCKVLCSPNFWRAQTLDGINNIIVLSDVNAQDENGWSPLHYAAEHGGPEKIQALIDAGAEVNARAKDRRTPLHHATGGETPENIQTLIDAGADVDARDEHGRPPLYFAAQSGTPVNVQALIDAGADLNARDNTGWSPLHIAATLGTPQVLIVAGANVDVRDEEIGRAHV